MTFIRPSSVTVSAPGAPYGFKGDVPSPPQNYIDANFPNILDKTGDIISAPAIITFEGIAPGNVIGDFAQLVMDGYSVQVFNSDSAAEFTSGSALSLLNGAEFYMYGFMQIGKEAGDPGGELRIVNGAFLTIDQGGQQNVNTGAWISINNDGYVNFASGGDLNILSGAVFNTASWAQWITPQVRTICQATQIGQALTGTWTTLVQGISSNAVGNQWVCPLERLHNGATLDQVVVTFQVWESHSGVPANLPSLSVVRYNNFNLDSAAALGIPDPQSFFPPPASGSAWYDSQNTQYLVYDCIHNNVIDNSQYTYYVVITDESGSNSLPDNNYGNITLSFSGITNQSWQL